MGFFEYLAFNNVDAVLTFIGFIGFTVTLVILASYLDNNHNNDSTVKIIKRFVPSLVIFCFMFFVGLLLPGESYFREMRLRKNNKTIDVHDIDYILDGIRDDLESIKDKLNMEE